MSVVSPVSAVVDLAGVSHAYGRTVALRGASLIVAPGETVAITGPSGCGKSTLLLVAAGVARPQAERAALLGLDLVTATEAQRATLRRRRVGLVLQFGQLVPDLRVADNIALALLLDGVARKPARTAALDWLERVDLVEVADAYPSELSGGQVQRVAVARALVTGPDVIFADEPTGSCDSASGELVLNLLQSGVRQQGAALVLVTHDFAVAARADREVRLRDGALEAEVALA